MDDERVFVVLVSHRSMLMSDSDILNVLSISHLEETAWTSIESNINANYIKNELGDPYISIHPESRFIRVIAPMRCGCDGTNIIYMYRDYKIIRKSIID